MALRQWGFDSSWTYLTSSYNGLLYQPLKLNDVGSTPTEVTMKKISETYDCTYAESLAYVKRNWPETNIEWDKNPHFCWWRSCRGDLVACYDMDGQHLEIFDV